MSIVGYSLNRHRLFSISLYIIIAIACFIFVFRNKTNQQHSLPALPVKDLFREVFQPSVPVRTGLNLLEDTGQSPSSYSVDSCTQGLIYLKIKAVNEVLQLKHIYHIYFLFYRVDELG